MTGRVMFELVSVLILSVSFLFSFFHCRDLYWRIIPFLVSDEQI